MNFILNKIGTKEPANLMKKVSRNLRICVKHCWLPNGYTAAMGNLTKFINKEPERKHLELWLEWWNEWREFIFNAFTVADGPKMNQAEAVHASWANRDQNNLSLLDIDYMDIRDNVLLEANLEAYKKGESSCGRGPSFAQRNY